MFALRVKTDEDLPRAATRLLRRAGYECLSVREQGLGGCRDKDLWDVAQEEHRFLVTGDKGFGDIRSYPPGTHEGVLLVRPDEDGSGPILDLLEKVLSAYDLADLADTITVVTPRGIRIRRPAD